MKPLNLRHLHEAAHNLERADFWTVKRQHQVAREFATCAILSALQALGLNERELAVVNAIVKAADGPVSDYDRAIATGEIVVESTARRLNDHERDLR